MEKKACDPCLETKCGPENPCGHETAKPKCAETGTCDPCQTDDCKTQKDCSHHEEKCGH